MAKQEKKQEPRHIVKRRILVTEFQAHRIDKSMNAANRLYNMGAAYYKPIVETLQNDPYFVSLLNQYYQWYKNNPKSDKKNPYQSEVSDWTKQMGLTEFSMQEWFGKIAKSSFHKCINSAIVQVLASNLYSAVRKVLFSSGKHIHFRKYGTTNSLQGKSNRSGIIYHEKTDSVHFCGMELPLKPARKSDAYLQEAMADGEVKYCRIVREPFKRGYKYFLQLVMTESAPLKFIAKSGETGQDPGISNSTFYGSCCGFETLAKGCEKYEKEIRTAAVKYERRRRMANPNNYNPDGTIKRGIKLIWKHTNGMLEALFELKNAYRRKSAHTKNYNGWLSNQVIRVTTVLRQEKMDYRALAKRSKQPAERSEKESVVVNKKGVKKTAHKFKRKRRFGRSVLRRAPGSFDKMLRDKAVRYGGRVISLNPSKTASSQVDHTTGKRTKIPLEQRTKRINGELVQRDFYSAFLNNHTSENNTLDRDQCVKDFPNFLKKQRLLVDKIRQEGDVTGNFGLSDFV